MSNSPVTKHDCHGNLTTLLGFATAIGLVTSNLMLIGIDAIEIRDSENVCAELTQWFQSEFYCGRFNIICKSLDQLVKMGDIKVSTKRWRDRWQTYWYCRSGTERPIPILNGYNVKRVCCCLKRSTSLWVGVSCDDIQFWTDHVQNCIIWLLMLRPNTNINLRSDKSIVLQETQFMLILIDYRHC